MDLLAEFDLSDEGFGHSGAIRIGGVDGEPDPANVRSLLAEHSPERIGKRKVRLDRCTHLRPFDADEAAAGMMVAPLERLVRRLGFTETLWDI